MSSNPKVTFILTVDDKGIPAITFSAHTETSPRDIAMLMFKLSRTQMVNDMLAAINEFGRRENPQLAKQIIEEWINYEKKLYIKPMNVVFNNGAAKQ